MYQIIKQTEEEKIVTYMKLSKKELVRLLLNSQAQLEMMLPKEPIYPYSSGNWQPNDHAEKCSCNPKNGGTGICGCVLSQQHSFTYTSNN